MYGYVYEYVYAYVYVSVYVSVPVYVYVYYLTPSEAAAETFHIAAEPSRGEESAPGRRGRLHPLAALPWFAAL